MPSQVNKTLKRRPSIYGVFLLLITVITLFILAAGIADDKSAKTSPNGNCGINSSGQITYTPTIYHHPQRDIVYATLMLLIGVLIFGLHRYKSKKYKALVMVAVLAIGIAVFIFSLQNALGPISEGIGCIPF